jgi:non-homologous end joining protein Ku
MPRPIWSGSISFGLVSVPVKLFSATSPKEVRFHMLHDKDGGRIQQKRVCSIDGDEVAWEHIVKTRQGLCGRGRGSTWRLLPETREVIKIWS